MTDRSLPPRNAIAPEHTWNAPSVFPSPDAWAAELEAVAAALPGFQTRFKGYLAGGPALLADFFDTYSDLLGRAGKILVYAGMESAVDTSNQDAAAMDSRASALFSQVLAAGAFANPEILSIGQATLAGWMDREPHLRVYRQYFDDLFRRQAHVRSAEVEEILGMLADPFGAVGSTAMLLANADLQFEPATGSDGTTAPVAQSTIAELMIEPDRELRRTAWEHYADGYLSCKNAFANNLATALKQDVLKARVRGHSSSLEAALFPYNIPVEVFHTLIDTFRRNLPTWHRYWAIRRRVLGVETLQPYDVWAPLTSAQPQVPYPQAVEWIAEGLRPLGEEYVAALRQGSLRDRWVDIYPNQGKRQGAFSSGWKGTFPFIMMSYNDSLNSLSTLAHELGHSMHSYLTWQTQPMIYSDYSLFVAEVASNFHQAMVRAHLLATQDDPGFQTAVIEEAMYNFHRYFFQMPTLARFELEMHERTERGEGLTAGLMIDRMAALFEEGYGGEMHVDRDRVGITWAQFGHLYANFYVFQYATGISAAHALAQRILSGTPGAAESYVAFLKAGSSLYPLDALKLAGVDMTTPAAVESAFEVLAGYVDRLEALTA
ncbi:MAG TPA: oligoendopeptidase F [Aggregatilineaceae bacterium]|nr:oligoendopeptidase F [Aggregatilineaceae bacterium]